MRLDRATAVLAAPVVVALLVAGWLLWTRGDPARQGGYCTNATIEIAGALEGAVDPGAGATPPVADILAQVDEVDVARFQVDTPDAIAAEVDLVATERSPDAFALVIVDYLERCGSPNAD